MTFGLSRNPFQYFPLWSPVYKAPTAPTVVITPKYVKVIDLRYRGRKSKDIEPPSLNKEQGK